jgi:hypothetical protein
MTFGVILSKISNKGIIYYILYVIRNLNDRNSKEDQTFWIVDTK